MHPRRVLVSLVLILPAGAGAARALTLEQALALARERAPGVLVARARVDEAAARLQGASVLLQHDPTVEGAIGTRDADSASTAESALAVQQTFELGGRRRARIDGAAAELDVAGAAAEDASRGVVREAALAFHRALHARDGVRLAAQAETLAADGLRAAQVRYAAGDAPALDVDLARAALARARSALRAAEAAHEAELGRLRLALGLTREEPLAVEGTLGTRPSYDLAALLANAPARADRRALAAEIRAAEAGVRLGRGLGWPELGLGARHEREEGDEILSAEWSVTLPIFDRGRGVRAEAAARARRLRLAAATLDRAIDHEIRTALEVYRLRLAAVDEIEREALPLVEHNERLAERSYDTGGLGLVELLFVRRESLDTRREHLDRLLDAAAARTELEFHAGLL
jgi:cobalt-zinc-cadmium efflux system outer membrane protein